MGEKFDIIKTHTKHINDAILREGCERFIDIFFDELNLSKDKNVMKTMAEELYKGSTAHYNGDKFIINFKFQDDN